MSATTDTAILLLPGRRSRAEDFASEGFVAAIRERHIDVELVAIDAHLGYYVEQRYRELPDIIQADVVVPLERRGRRRFWVVGTSLGALGALAFAKKFPEKIAGLLLMGAYLGEDAILDDVARAGGLARWDPSDSVGYDYERRTWGWLKGYLTGEERPPMYLAYGKSDRFAQASLLVAPAIAKSRVFVTEGGHDFATWLTLWCRFLDGWAEHRTSP